MSSRWHHTLRAFTRTWCDRHGYPGGMVALDEKGLEALSAVLSTSGHWRERRLRAGIGMAITALDVPSAEYVPAIPDAVALLVTTLHDVEGAMTTPLVVVEFHDGFMVARKPSEVEAVGEPMRSADYVGGLWDTRTWRLGREVILTTHGPDTSPPCPHCILLGDGRWQCPRVVIAWNDGGGASTGVCLDCILAAEQHDQKEGA